MKSTWECVACSHAAREAEQQAMKANAIAFAKMITEKTVIHADSSSKSRQLFCARCLAYTTHYEVEEVKAKALVEGNLGAWSRL
jgi:hypothetical protein